MIQVQATSVWARNGACKERSEGAVENLKTAKAPEPPSDSEFRGRRDDVEIGHCCDVWRVACDLVCPSGAGMNVEHEGDRTLKPRSRGDAVDEREKP